MNIPDELDFPRECKVDRVIPKKDFYEVGFNTSDKNIFTNNVKQIKWLYYLKEDNIQIPPYIDEEKDYTELEVLTLTLKKDNKIERICELIHRYIPYPILLIISYHEKIMLSVAHKRNSKINEEAVTITDMRYTNWIENENPNKFALKLIDNLKFQNLDKKDMYTLYSDIVNKIIQYNGSRYAGEELSIPIDKIKEINNKIISLNKKIENIKHEIKKETQFNKKLEMNMKTKNMKKEITDLEQQLLED
ncbi:MAG: DUF4391 domain-containing protein [Methanosphaera sp.]